MKILFVIAALRNGGAERVLEVVANYFSKNNQVSIAILENNENLYEFDKNIKFINLNVYENGSKFSKYIKLRKCFKNENPNVIISFIDWTNVACAIANFGLNYKLIATEHNSHEFLQSKIFTFIRNLAYRQVDALTLLTKSDLNYYSKFVKNCVIMYNPFFGDLSQISQKENIILSVARLEKVKGYDVFFDALSKIDQSLLKDYRILIAGDGSLRDVLEKNAKKLDLNIEFLGHRTDIKEIYKKAKIFVLASYSEGLPNVLIESAFYGCIRISSKTAGGIELIEDGKTGFLFDIGNSDELAKKLEMSILKEDLGKLIIKNTKATLENFKTDNITKKWENLIRNLAEKK
ncbi:glycosyltransferase [Campylobacter sputorum]|uniref:glycosyltransferase n=1 Tax=Campylobacter sputorum TaxID=206 RepID=UPI00053BFD09|nr:glycosyltransferase [Campylobacter sputorum]